MRDLHQREDFQVNSSSLKKETEGDKSTPQSCRFLEVRRSQKALLLPTGKQLRNYAGCI